MLWVINLKKNYKNLLLIIIFVFVLGISVNVFAADTSCTGVFTAEFIEALDKYVYVPIKFIAPIGLILLTGFDYAKVVFSGKKEDMSKVTTHFMKRFVAALIIFFAPDVITLLVDLVQQNSIKSCLNQF
jgi:L-cystine uptake protein TcyP (sodium:dicarboxylate symporter family)